MGSVVDVRSLTTGRTVTVRVNDRGPFARGRILDLSKAAAERLGMIGTGTDRIELRVIGYRGRAGAIGALRVQVASFIDPANAQSLATRLRVDYPDAKVVAVDLPEGRRYRVVVGQFQTETQARDVADRLEASYGLEPLVLRDDT